MYAALDGDLDLGADAIICGDEDRVLEAGGLEVEQAAEAADFRVGAGTARGTDGRLDQLDHFIAGIDVDACLRVGEAALGFVLHLDPSGRGFSLVRAG